MIIGGHSHTRVDPAEMINGVLVAQAGSDNKFLGRVELLVRDGRVVEKKGALIDLKRPLAEDADVKAMIARFNQNPAFARVIAEAPLGDRGQGRPGLPDDRRHARGRTAWTSPSRTRAASASTACPKRSPSRTSTPSIPSATRWSRSP